MRSTSRIDTFKSGTIQSDRSIKTVDRPKSPDRMTLLNEALLASGQQIKLEEYLRQKFIDVGWKDELKNQVKNYIKQQKGMKQYTRTELQRECDKIGNSKYLLQQLKKLYRINQERISLIDQPSQLQVMSSIWLLKLKLKNLKLKLKEDNRNFSDYQLTIFMFKLQEQLKEKDKVIERASWIIQQLQIKLQGDTKENISQLTTARTLNETKRESQININEQITKYKQQINEEKNIYDWITQLINNQSQYFQDFNLKNYEELIKQVSAQQTLLNQFQKQAKQMDLQFKEYQFIIETLQYQLSTCKDHNQMLQQMIKRLLNQKDYNCLQILFDHQVLEQTDILNSFIIFNQGHQQLTIKCGQLNHQYQLSSQKKQQSIEQSEIQNYKTKLNEYEQMIQDIQQDNKQLLETLNKSLEEIKQLEIQNQELKQQLSKQDQKEKQLQTQLVQLCKIRTDYEYMSNQNPKLLDMKSICKNQFQSILYLINFLEEEKIISIKLLNEMSAQMRQLRNYFKEI